MPSSEPVKQAKTAAFSQFICYSVRIFGSIFMSYNIYVCKIYLTLLFSMCGGGKGGHFVFKNMHSYGLKICEVVRWVVLMSELFSIGPHHPEICVDNPVKLNKKI